MYCAELVNTATNVVFMWLGFKGIRNCIMYSQQPVFILAYIGYLVVGAGSMAFHSTLKCMHEPWFPFTLCVPCLLISPVTEPPF